MVEIKWVGTMKSIIPNEECQLFVNICNGMKEDVAENINVRNQTNNTCVKYFKNYFITAILTSFTNKLPTKCKVCLCKICKSYWRCY